MRVLKMRSAGQPSEVDNNQFRAIIDADPLTTAREAAVELNINHSTVIWHLMQTGRVNKLDKRMSHERTQNKKMLSF